MKASAWIMLVVGCLILYGGLAYCLAVALGWIGRGRNKKKNEQRAFDETLDKLKQGR